MHIIMFHFKIWQSGTFTKIRKESTFWLHEVSLLPHIHKTNKLASKLTTNTSKLTTSTKTFSTNTKHSLQTQNILYKHKNILPLFQSTAIINTCCHIKLLESCAHMIYVSVLINIDYRGHV